MTTQIESLATAWLSLNVGGDILLSLAAVVQVLAAARGENRLTGM